jgi:hypothetical protein
VKIELDLTQREADELRRADHSPRDTSGDTHEPVARELESAVVKLGQAIDRASRA